MNTHDRWEAVNDDFLKFDRIEVKLSMRPDLHAFMLLNRLFPGNRDIVSGAEHDEIYLDISSEQIESLSDDHVLELNRCGVRFDSEYECLCMFV